MISKKNLIFLGAPGAGKGTFSAMLLDKYPLVHISTGDILRTEIKNGTDLGKQAAALMEKGNLVPDDIVAGMVRDRLAKQDCDNGFILDGFPRTVNQADLLEEALQDIGRAIDRVVFFDVEDELILKRLTARISCKDCGEIFNKIFHPPQEEGKCDKCGGGLFQRPDDSLETARERLRVYYENTQPLIDYYSEKGLLLPITETQKELVFRKLEKELA
ncbi:adenylate kinase [Lentisphaerota bacterium ZTH]|nr:adenylate kinase [Lentisphaerota bacterium]WET06852.1 adenylate kinase [Lentisphaerota bacterium ZTH]